MFPMIEKTYRAKITEEIERDLRFLGQSRVDALTSEFDMTLLKEKPGLKVYELCEKEFYTMKGVTTVNAQIAPVMAMLRMETSSKLRDLMGEICGPLFLDGLVLYKAREDPSRPYESLSVNWMALQSSKPHLPHRDYVFLRYGDAFEKNVEHGMGNSGSGLFIGASIWESIELDGCAPLPSSQNVVRLRFRRCGIVVEEISQEELKISFFLSEAHPGRASVSTLTRSWMTKMVSCVSEIGNVFVARALASQVILSKKEFVKDGTSCFLCVKNFSVLRRKHHCRVCGDVVCGKCSEMKSLKQGGLNKEVRICYQCKSHSATSLGGSGGSDSKPPATSRSVSAQSQYNRERSQQDQAHQYSASMPSHQKQSFASTNYSISSSEASNSIYDDEGSLPSASLSSNTPPTIHEHFGGYTHGSGPSSGGSSYSEPRVKTYPNNGRTGNAMSNSSNMRPMGDIGMHGSPRQNSPPPAFGRSVGDVSYGSQPPSSFNHTSKLINTSSKASASSSSKKNDMILLGSLDGSSKVNGTAAAGSQPNDMILLDGLPGSSSKTNNSKMPMNNDMNPMTNLNDDAVQIVDEEMDFSEHYKMKDAHQYTKEQVAAMELAATVHENTSFAYALSYSSRQDWPKPPMPRNEMTRLKKVRELLLVDPGNRFQDMCEYAAAELGCSIAAICFIGDKSGFLMAKVGLEKRELPRNILFDSHAIMSEEATIILDATEDVRFINNPLVKEEKVRFYAGFPLITHDGYIVGSLSVADPFARECLTGDKMVFLKNLADAIMRGIVENTANRHNLTREHEKGSGPQPSSMSMGSSRGGAMPGAGAGPGPAGMNIVEAQMTMQELLKTAYSTQCQMRMQVSPTDN